MHGRTVCACGGRCDRRRVPWLRRGGGRQCRSDRRRHAATGCPCDASRSRRTCRRVRDGPTRRGPPVRGSARCRRSRCWQCAAPSGARCPRTWRRSCAARWCRRSSASASCVLRRRRGTCARPRAVSRQPRLPWRVAMRAGESVVLPGRRRCRRVADAAVSRFTATPTGGSGTGVRAGAALPGTPARRPAPYGRWSVPMLSTGCGSLNALSAAKARSACAFSASVYWWSRLRSRCGMSSVWGGGCRWDMALLGYFVWLQVTCSGGLCGCLVGCWLACRGCGGWCRFGCSLLVVWWVVEGRERPNGCSGVTGCSEPGLRLVTDAGVGGVRWWFAASGVPVSGCAVVPLGPSHLVERP